MDFSYPEEYSSEETDRSSGQNDDTGTGRSYECVFCKRGFTTAQALGGHMNIHRKDRANKTKPNFPSSSSSKVVDDNFNNYADLGFYSAIPSHLAGGNYYSTSPHEVCANYNNYPQIYFPAPACGIKPSHVLYSEVLCEENQRDHRHLFGQDWRSLYGNPLSVVEHKDKVEDNSEEDGLDLELRLGHHP